MLFELRIRNLAIVSELTVTFGSGLNVLTGETGAGKSILVAAISLLAGARSIKEDVRQGEDLAVIEGVIQLAPDSSAWKLLDEMGVPYSSEHEIILRRTINSDGRSRAFVNNCQFTVNGLTQLASHWIDISSQHAQQKLIEDHAQIDLLDAFGNCISMRDQYYAVFEGLRKMDQELIDLKERREKGSREKEFILFQLKELNDAQLIPKEEEELNQVHQRMAHSEKLMRAMETVEMALDGDQGALRAMTQVVSEFKVALKMDHSLESWLLGAQEIFERCKELKDEASQYLRKLDFDPAQIERVNERLSKLQALSRKYGSIDRAIEEKERLVRLLRDLDFSQDRELELFKGREKAISTLIQKAKNLTEARRIASKAFSQRVTKELRLLGMPSAKLNVRFVMPQPEIGFVVQSQVFGPQGAEEVCFDFAPNPGEGVRPLSAIASGGELSRILLGIKGVAMETKDSKPITFLFDEVDTGIGGETAERVGIRLRALGIGQHQVLCVTHLAQVACYAHQHLCIEKAVRHGRTVTTVNSLDSDHRKEELARMIGGIEVSDRALAHAGELLKRGTHFEVGL